MCMHKLKGAVSRKLLHTLLCVSSQLSQGIIQIGTKDLGSIMPKGNWMLIKRCTKGGLKCHDINLCTVLFVQSILRGMAF